MRLIFATILLALVASPARAAWHEASSAHFVVYADDSEARLQTFSQHLERYHAALETIMGKKLPAPSPSARVVVFVVSGDQAVKRLYGKGSRYVGAFYIPRAGGSVAIVPRVNTRGATTGDLDFSMLALLHEYAHHFMISTNAFAAPRWFSEGGAEFFASADFGKDGSVGLGRPANHRAAELLFARGVTAAQLLDPAAYERSNRGKSFDAFYGKSWLLYHYLVLGGVRKGQLESYLRLLMQGKTSAEAGLEAFGPFDKLENDLGRYLRKSRIKMIRLPGAALQTGPVQIRRVSEGEAAMMPIRIRSRRGVSLEEASSLLTEAREIATRFPSDAAVLAALAEAEFDAGYDAEAIAAADKALAIDRKQVNAYVQKGFAMFRRAETDSDPAAFTGARAPFVALNRIENDHPLALAYYYQSFIRSGQKPSETAVHALERAVELAPFDFGLRMTLAMQHLRDGRRDLAKANLTPIAYSPHRGSLAEHAQKVMARIDAEPNWDGTGIEPPADDDDGDDEAAERRAAS